MTTMVSVLTTFYNAIKTKFAFKDDAYTKDQVDSIMSELDQHIDAKLSEIPFAEEGVF